MKINNTIKKSYLYCAYHNFMYELMCGAGVSSKTELLKQPERLKFSLNLMYVKRIDRKYGTNFSGTSHGRIKQSELGVSEQRANDYSASPKDIIKALRKLPVKASDKIIDIGCGRGLALWYMEKFPFSQIAGLELSEILLSDVYNNLQKVSRYKDEKCVWGTVVEKYCLIKADAGLYGNYDEFTYFYCYNSLPKLVMKEFMERVRESLERNPRHIYLLYLMPEFPEEVSDLTYMRLIRKGKKKEIRNGMWIFENTMYM